VPGPLYHDEFSYLLGADTFLHGRLTNPTPPVPIAFETIHENISPTYQSMYMPGNALALTAGAAVGLPWLTVVLLTAVLCGTIYWMVAGWLPRSYALFAGLATVAITGNLNWWFDNYFCLALTSIGTALVLGSLPRIAKTRATRWALLAGLGLSVLILTRPYEGACVTAPCLLGLLWALRGAGLQRLSALVAAACAVPAIAVSWLLDYNRRGTGHALLFPYMVNLVRYHITGPFLFSRMHALPVYDLETLRRFYIAAEVPQFEFVHGHPWLFLAHKITVYDLAVAFGFGLPLLAGLIYLLRTRREDLRWLPLLGFCGLVVNVSLMAWSPFPQYIAPAFPLLLLLVAFGYLQIRRLSFAKIAGAHLTRGLALAQLLFVLVLFGYRVSEADDYPEPQYVSKDRAAVAAEVLHHPGKQLCLVRYTPTHASWQEWVFNGADLQGERLLWARSLDPQTDRAVIAAFPGRQVWLVTPDFAGHLVAPYDPSIPFPATPQPHP
jgi:4-amino-4-deoxy-L-arabinose transferase-like glycosyltransferase